MSDQLAVEFTIEPFVEGDPGKHVTAAIEAIQARGVQVDIGPFGSMFLSSVEEVPNVIAALLEAAYSNGATHVNVHVARSDS